MLQFHSSDTVRWQEGFGTGITGDLSYGGGALVGQAGCGYATFTGTSGAYSGTFTNVSSFNQTAGGRIGDIVIIHQTQGTNATNWQINKITNVVGSTVYFKYPLQQNFVAGAQIISSGNFNNVTLTGTTTPPAGWNGSSGGLGFIFAKGTVTVNGSINTSGYGFAGGSGIGSNSQYAYRGGNIGGNPAQGTASYNGGGGGWQAPGGGGANGANGSNAGDGSSTGGGTAVGNANLTLLSLGGGGGGGNYEGGTGGGSGGTGAGAFIIIAKNIVVNGSIVNTGNNGGTNMRGGGGGAGGSVLLKCMTATLGTNLISANGGAGGQGTDNGGSYIGARGGNGSTGRIALDYKTSYTGSTNSPAVTVRQDLTLDYPPGGFMNFL